MASVGGATFVVLDPTQPVRVVDPGIAKIAKGIQHDAQSHTPVDTGQLRSGWQLKRVRAGTYMVTNGVRYARYVEFGTRKMAAQPMLGPAVLNARSRVGA